MSVLTKGTIIPTTNAKEVKEVRRVLASNKRADSKVVKSLNSLPSVKVSRHKNIFNEYR